jgi:multiple sugar transport system permease protein
MKNSRGRIRTGTLDNWCLVAPAILLFIVVIAVPLFSSALLAFTDKRLGMTAEFVGLKNLIAVWQDPLFRRAALNSVKFSVLVTLLKVSGAYVLAFVLEGADNRRLLLGVLLVPWLLPGSAACLLWIWLLYEPSGVLYTFMKALCGSPITMNWFGTPSKAMAVLVAFNVWRELPLWSVVMFASRLRVPRELREQCLLCGLGRAATEVKVVLPMLRPTLFISAALMIMWAFGEFQSVHLLTRGGPANSTQLLSYYAYEVGYGGGTDLGLAVAAMVTVVPLVMLIVGPLLEAGILQARKASRAW